MGIASSKGVGRDFRSPRAITALAWLALVLGLGTYASDPLGFSHPGLALYAMGSLAAVALLCRVLSALRHRPRLGVTLVVLALFFYAELMTLATGLTGGPFIGLYALALWAAALSWRPWQVVALAVVILGLTELQSGFLDRMNDMHPVASAMALLDGLGPPVAAAWIIAWLRPRLAPFDERESRADPSCQNQT